MTDAITIRVDGLPSEQALEERSRAICEEVGEAHELIRTLGWETLRKTAGAVLREGLANQDGLSWLACAWTKAQELKAAARETLNGVPERKVKLDSHSIKQEVLPTVTFKSGLLELRLPFTLDLGAEIECVDLVVQHGCLVALQAARLTPSAVLSFKGIEINRMEGGTIEFPQYRLAGSGLQIAEESKASTGA